MTKIISEKDLAVAKEELDKGNLIIFPTETVYGLGANALDDVAVSKIFDVKKRAKNNPLIVHLKNKEEIEKYAIINNDIERKLIDNFMPGPFTLILQKRNIVPFNVTCNLDTVGIRIPIDNIAHKLLDMLDYPIAAPSANLSSRPSGTKVEDIFNEFDGKIKYIIDGGRSTIGLESTVCKVINNVPVILRPGFITKEDIENVVGKCEISKYVLKEANGVVESPGMLYKHYAPKTKCLLVDKERIAGVLKEYHRPILIGSSKVNCLSSYKYLPYGDDLVTIAHNIFALLREADKLDGDVIIIESTKTTGLGLAIMNRLIRTCEFNYIKVNDENSKI